jgi:DNA-binding NarL/FixJ family response regulator
LATTVLIVDDHPGFRSSARMLLEAEGYEVISEAADGHSAIAQAREHEPDVVLLDVQLPDIDGFAVAAELSSRATGPCVVLTSSRDGCDYGSLAEESGACGFIPKSELSAAAMEAMRR